MNGLFLMRRAVFAIALAGCAAAAATEPGKKAAGWPDSAPLTKRNLVYAVDGGGFVRVDVLGERLFRIRHSKSKQWMESASNRYGVFNTAFTDVAFEQSEAGGLHTVATKESRLTVSSKGGAISLANADGRLLTEQAAPVYETGGGYDVRFTLAKEERLYGLGDVSRENVMRRGGVYEIWVKNVNSYIPIPVVLSNKGWGLLMNTTWRNIIDVGKSDPERMICKAPRSDLDYYLFCGPDYRSLLASYTSLTGRPSLLPIWGYGLTYVCNQNIDAFNLINEAVIHFGFLQTWAQENNGDYWYQPWLLKEEHIAVFRQYDQLRYRLLPCLYSAAVEAALTGYPVMRAMPMVYPDDPAWDARLSQYMLGDFLLVSAFSKDVRLPAGDWIDF